MKISIRHVRMLAVVLSCCASSLLRAQVNVTTYHNDASRTGQNTQETILTPSNVNSYQFGKLFSVAVDGYVYAQPLYLSGVTIGGGVHNVLYVATEHDSVFAIDADSGTVYWKISLIASGGRTVNTKTDVSAGCTDLVPEVGITGTPVIDAASGTLYVVAKSYVNGAGVQYLHAIDVATAAEKFGGPVSILASVAGTGYDATGNTVKFNPLFENQRPALLLENGHVVIGWSSHCDQDPWHGWVISYSASTLSQEAVFNTSPNGSKDGVWMSGGGLAADASGNIYFATGNGTWNGTSDFGDSIVRLGPPAGGSFPVVDYFTPYNQGMLALDDTDLGSGGLVLLPTLSSGRQLLAQQSKQGTIYLLDRNNLGKYCVTQIPACGNSDPQIVQEIMGASGGLWGSPAYWNGSLYWTGVNEPIKAYSFNANSSGLISQAPTSESAQSFAFSSPTPSISANGNTNGILWALDGSSDNSTCVAGADCLGLFAYDATDLTKLLYKSSQAANNRDSPGSAVKFETPIIANGKVYVGTQGAATAYGELGTTLPPGSVNLIAAENVVGSANAGSPVTNGGLDGSGDAYAANLLGTSVTWSGSTFILGGAGTANAVSSTTIALPAAKDAMVNLLATGVHGNQPDQTFVVTYTDGTTTNFTQSLSDWHTPQNYAGESLALTMAYRVIKSGATNNGPFYLYGYSFAVNSAKTVASISLPNNRNVVVLAVDVSASGAGGPPPAASPNLSPPPGSYASAQTVALSDSTPGAAIYYTTNGTTPTAGSTLYNPSSPLQISTTTTVQAIAVASGFSNSAVTSGTYTITSQGTTPVSVNLAAVDNVTGIANNGSPVTNGGLDGEGDAYSGSLTGASVSWSGAQYTLGSAGTADAVSSSTIALPAGNYSTLSLLATGVRGNQPNQTFVVTYTDGTTANFTQSLSDWHTPQNYAGESQALTMAYRLTPTGAIDNRTFYLYGYSFTINSVKTVQSITLPNDRDVVVLAVDLSNTPVSSTTPVSVNLAAVDNVTGIANNGSPVPNGGLDGGGDAYSGSLTGASVSWSGAQYTLGSAGTADAVSSSTIALPAGNYSTLSLLATGVRGNQPNQTFVVAYTDGTTTNFTQSLSDWHTPQNYPGESQALTMAYRLTSAGAIDNRTFYLYGYSFTINSVKTVQSITLPNDRDVVVLAVDVTP
jgi:hypothetical protein